MSKKTYCAEDKCEFEVYSSEESDVLLDEKANSKEVYSKKETDGKLDLKMNKSSILSGTSSPTSSTGNNGDIYLKYE